MAKAKCTKQIREDLSGVDFTFADGTVLAVEVASLSKNILMNLVAHGISQKVGDSYAGDMPVEGAIEKATEVIKRLVEGDWKAVRISSGSAKNSLLAEAFAAASGRTVEECQAVLADMEEPQKKALRKHPQVALQIADIQAKRAAEKAAKLAETNKGGDLAADLATIMAATGEEEPQEENAE
jgi:hypothetical protein